MTMIFGHKPESIAKRYENLNENLSENLVGANLSVRIAILYKFTRHKYVSVQTRIKKKLEFMSE